MYTSLGRLKVDRKAPRTAPPTPNSPANIPDSKPPQTAVLCVFGKAHSRFRNRYTTYKIRKAPRNRLSGSICACRERDAPRKLATMPERPKPRIRIQSSPRLNRSTFQISPHRWMMPTKRSAKGSGTNKAMTGIITVDVPNPVAVPIPEAKSVNRQSSITCVMQFFPSSQH